LPSASRATSPSLSRSAPASSSSSRRSLSQTTSPRSHSSPQPSCDRFVRLHEGNCLLQGYLRGLQFVRPPKDTVAR
jgi:hypothetical protein